MPRLPERPVYQNARKMLLCKVNLSCYEGWTAKDIGSPHTPASFVWPISLCIQGMTAQDDADTFELADMLEKLDADTFLMHEGVNVNDAYDFTRPWFDWANSIFSKFEEKAVQFVIFDLTVC